MNRRDFLGAAAGACVRLLQGDELPQENGYRGIWYANQPSGDEYAYKYSGGFATYPQQHTPIAVYSPQARKTFFVYGGTLAGKQELLHMVSYFDHRDGIVPRPRVLLNKRTDDAHDNPTLCLDESGHLWIFSNAHGTSRPAYIHRSARPYAIDAFERILTSNFSYGQPWSVGSQGFLFLHTRYARGRGLHWMTSRDGREWTTPRPLANFAQGHYQISASRGQRVVTAFNYHPAKGGLNARTNLYFLETSDLGRNWTNALGDPLDLPLTEIRNRALVRDFESEKRLVYLKDLGFDSGGRPAVLFLTSRGYESGPRNDPRTFQTARWTGREWEIRDAFAADHNYDYGSLYVERNEWRVLAAALPGPQPYCTGGEIGLWISRDDGRTWRLEREVTRSSPWNHTYPRRPVGAHPDFYALWADGDTKKASDSALYFTNRAGDSLWRLPRKMESDTARPERVS